MARLRYEVEMRMVEKETFHAKMPLISKLEETVGCRRSVASRCDARCLSNRAVSFKVLCLLNLT